MPVLEEPPFEVSETGWGEFEATLRIHFHDENEKPIDIAHPLKLYPPGSQQPTTKKVSNRPPLPKAEHPPPLTHPPQPVVHELYDELVFNAPNEEFYTRLMGGAQRQLPRHPLMDFFTPFPSQQEEQDIQKLLAAQRFIDEELQGAHVCTACTVCTARCARFRLRPPHVYPPLFMFSIRPY
jgi:YEATS domain-containing protein 4